MLVQAYQIMSENLIEQLQWVINQNEKSEKTFRFTKTKREADNDGKELGLIVCKIGFLDNTDSDIQIMGKNVFQN